jgi:PadR family transcriptional regulator AphA
MDIKCAILGFLSWKPFTGYELKKLMAESDIFYWSGNNNQIYTALVQLHKEGLVTIEVQHQEHLPSRKIYTLTENGFVALKEWVFSNPELPQLKKSFLVQLAWSNQLNHKELDTLIEKYENEVNMQVVMHRENRRRGNQINPSRTPRETYIWNMISDNFIRSYESELAWVQELRNNLTGKT